ncbi:MAG TPA: hypothetical protein VKU01_12330 [Bryobacteraceae bacterium]|nr:hypothetical protein [Bryobacteraceae bacterium]
MNAMNDVPSVALAPKQQDSPEKIRHAAMDFEALMLEQMLQSAHPWDSDESGDSSSIMGLGMQQFAQALANGGGIGIAKMVVAGLSKDANR